MTVPDTAPSGGFANLASEGECPSEDDLVAMIEGALSAQQLASIEKHVATCDACASVVGDLGALGDPGKPRAIDRYQLDRRIAAGGMGEVWAAWDPKLRREIAVKLVKPERSDDTRERDRLLREARALARLTHPNVIAVHDVGEQDGEVFIVSELVSGDTLANRGGPSADWRVIARLYSQAARGLAAAHAAGLVHRDVKPANLLLGTDGRVRVADFGLAVRSTTNTPNETPDVDASLSIGQSITQRGHIAGTPAYMAPEQRAGLKVEAPADQFALCVALGEALSGRRPPMEITAVDMVKFVGERRPMEPDLETLCMIVARGLAVLPAERFPDMASLAEALDELVPPIKVSGEHRAMMRTPTGGMRAVRTPTGGTAVVLESNSVPDVLPTEKSRPRWSGTLVIGGIVIVAAAALLVMLVTRDRDRGLIATPKTPARTTPAPMPSPPIEHHAVDEAVMPAIDAPAEKTVPRDPPTEMIAPPPKSEAPGVAPPATGSSGPSAMDETEKLVPSTTAPPIAQSGVTLDMVHAAIKRRDGKACRAALASLTRPPPSDFRVASAHAVCEMIAGNCDGGTREQRALYVREGTPPDSAEIIADLYCPVNTSKDPAVRLRRLAKQIDLFATSFDCDEYLPHARAAAKTVTSDRDKHVVGGVLRDIAFCYSKREDCTTAKKILDEAKVFIPGFRLDELTAACR
jgi:serine/threonine protein kinase